MPLKHIMQPVKERRGRHWMAVDPEKEITFEGVCAVVSLVSLAIAAVAYFHGSFPHVHP
jgi:hypothetical protein